MVEIADNCLLRPVAAAILVKLLTPVPVIQVQVVVHEMVVPLRIVALAHWLPVAPEMPHWSR